MARNTVIVSVLADTKQFAKGMKDADGALGKIGSLGKLAAKTVVGVGAALAGLAVGGGIARALKIDEAKTKLSALGYAGKQLEGVMDSALKSVRGTSFGLDAAATVAANALAAGVPQGERLTKALTTVANTAALAGVSMDEMGSIFGKVWANGKVTTQEMNQLADRGVPIWKYLGKAFGVSNEELRKMIERGEVTADMFESALGPAVEGIAGKMGTSFKGMAANAMAALSRVGAMFAGPLIESAKGFLGEFTTLVDGIGERLKPAADALGGWLSGFDVSGMADKILAVFDNGFSFDGLLKAAVNGVQRAADWLSTGGAQTLVSGLVAGRATLFNAAFQVFPAILQALIAVIPAIVQGVTSLVLQLAGMLVTQAPIILDGAIQLFRGLLTALVTVLPSLLEAIVTLLPAIVGALLSMLPALLDAAVDLFTALVEALPLILPPLIAAIVALLPKLIATILGLIPKILDAAVKLFTALVESLPIILPLLLQAIIDLLPKIISTVIGMIPKLLTAAINLFVALVEAIPRIVPQLVRALIDLAPKMVSAIIGLVPQLLRAGMDLIGGLVQGLWRAAGSVGQALLDIAGGAIQGFLGFLGIKSPSRLFAGYGKNVVQGLVKGLDGSQNLLDRAMSNLSGTVAGGFDASLSVGGGMALAGGGNTYNITVQAVSPNAEVGRAVVEAITEYEQAGGRL